MLLPFIKYVLSVYQETLVSAHNCYITQKSLPRRIFPWQLLLTPSAALQVLIAENRKDKISLSLWGITLSKKGAECSAGWYLPSLQEKVWSIIMIWHFSTSGHSFQRIITVQSAFTLSAQISSLFDRSGSSPPDPTHHCAAGLCAPGI